MSESWKQQLEEATKKHAEALEKANALRSKKGWTKKVQEAFEVVEFWSNKKSFLSNAK